MIKKYIDLLELEINDFSKIPKNIFRTSKYKIDELPKEVMDIYEDEMINNPEYTLYYFDDDDCLKFIEDLDDKRLLDAYNKLIPTAYKGDLWSYCILLKYGGIYCDYAHRAILRYDELIGKNKEVYVRDLEINNWQYGIYNAFICTIPNSQILKKAIETSIYKIEKEEYGINSLDIGGCQTLSGAYNTLKGKKYYDFIEINETIKYKHIGVNNKKEILENPEEFIDEYISDNDGNLIIKCRDIKNYYEVTYTENNNKSFRPNTHYHELWNNKNVFKDNRWFSIEELYKKVLNIKADLNGVYFYYKSEYNLEKIEEAMKESKEYKNLII
jgi:hypothetical protein